MRPLLSSTLLRWCLFFNIYPISNCGKSINFRLGAARSERVRRPRLYSSFRLTHKTPDLARAGKRSAKFPFLEKERLPMQAKCDFLTCLIISYSGYNLKLICELEKLLSIFLIHSLLNGLRLYSLKQDNRIDPSAFELLCSRFTLQNK